MKKNLKINLGKVYNLLLNHFGFLNWWPGETRLEIVCGALLTQNTNWHNVEKALDNLKSNNLMELDALLDIPMEKLEELIKPSGFFRQKAKRLKNLLLFLKKNYNWDGVSLIKTANNDFRKNLLSLNGIGPETADSILLYAFDVKFFVVDAYTKRLFSRFGLEDTKYDDIALILSKIVKNEFNNSLDVYKDFHAQIVELAKKNCKKKPVCKNCPLKTICYQNI